MQIRRNMLSQLRGWEDQHVIKTPGAEFPSSMPMSMSMSMPLPVMYQHQHRPVVAHTPPHGALQYHLRPSAIQTPPHAAPQAYTLRPIASPMAAPLPSLLPPSRPLASPVAVVTDTTHKCALSFILSDPAPVKASTAPSSSTRELKGKRRSTPGVGSKSKFCMIEGCTSRAKHARKCWRHGGSVKCKVSDCINRAKSRGVCWSHGGGTTCSHPSCGTIAVSHGFCWAHGGGKRCQVDDCSRPAYERTENYCAMHFKKQKRTASTGSSTSAFA